MKKIVLDPPRLKLVNTLYSSIHPDLIPPDALSNCRRSVAGVLR
jgi:hypothetical protein